MRIMPKRVFIESIVRIESIRCSGKLHKRTKTRAISFWKPQPAPSSVLSAAMGDGRGRP
jgi:hypothetical protein